MNRPIRVLDPTTVPRRKPLEIGGRLLWDPDTFAAHRLPLTNRINGSRLIPKPRRRKP